MYENKKRGKIFIKENKFDVWSVYTSYDNCVQRDFAYWFDVGLRIRLVNDWFKLAEEK